MDIPEDDLLDKRKFYSEQLEQALSLIVGGNTLQGGLWPSSSEPELRSDISNSYVFGGSAVFLLLESFNLLLPVLMYM